MARSLSPRKTKRQVSATAGPSASPLVVVTERNVQLHTANQKTVGASHAGSVVSSAERSRRYEKARAAFEMVEARVAMIQAAEDMAAGSQAGSVGRRLEDVPPVRQGLVDLSPPYYPRLRRTPSRAFSPSRLLRPFTTCFHKREMFTSSTRLVS